MSILQQIQEYIDDEVVDIEDLKPENNPEVPTHLRRKMKSGEHHEVMDDIDDLDDIDTPAYKRKLPLSKQKELGIADEIEKERPMLGGDPEKPAYMRKHGLIDKDDPEIPAFKRKQKPSRVLKPFSAH